MQLPRSFAQDGFTTAAEARRKRFLPGLKRPGIMISTEGETNTGKTEFALSCPGPGIVIAVDRGYDAALDNPEPPITRRDDFAFIELALSSNSQNANHVDIWKEFYGIYIKALANREARTIVIDGDSDTWETQRLAEFAGQFQQVASLRYVSANAVRRVMINRGYDSGKIVIATNKVRPLWSIKRGEDGNPILRDGKEVRENTGDVVKQGFDDDNYLWSIQLRHLYRPARYSERLKKEIPQGWGIRILKCKSNPGLLGTELWDSDCNFESLVALAYPNVKAEEWGLSANI